MHVLADGVAFGDRCDHGIAEVLRMRAREPDALDAVDRVAGTQELTELAAQIERQVAAPGVDVLAEQRDLAHALAGELRHLGDDLARPPRRLAAADGRHDAVRAGRVAAHRHLHPRLKAPLAVLRKLGSEHAIVEAEAPARDPDAAGAEPFAEMRDRARAEGDVDPGVELEDALALRLRVAAADGDHAARVLALPRQRGSRGTRRASCRASRGSCRC